jgi:hypothetical protein
MRKRLSLERGTPRRACPEQVAAIVRKMPHAPAATNLLPLGQILLRKPQRFIGIQLILPSNQNAAMK